MESGKTIRIGMLIKFGMVWGPRRTLFVPAWPTRTCSDEFYASQIAQHLNTQIALSLQAQTQRHHAIRRMSKRMRRGRQNHNKHIFIRSKPHQAQLTASNRCARRGNVSATHLTQAWSCSSAAFACARGPRSTGPEPHHSRRLAPPPDQGHS